MVSVSLSLPCAIANENGEGEAKASQQRVIEQVIVVAHKDARSIRQIAANVTALSRNDLQAELATSISDVFRYIPGIDSEASGTRFGNEGINIRGIGGNRVAILADGVPLPDHFDVGSFSNATRDFLDAGLIQNIEVLHGPASALYGSSAIGGVVAVSTPDPVDLTGNRGFGGEMTGIWRGEDESVHSQAMAAVGDHALGLLVGASWRSGQQADSAAADEALDKRDYDRRSVLIKVVADDPWGNTWRASLTHQDAHTLSDLNSLLGTGRYRSTTALEGDDRYDMDVLNLSYHFTLDNAWVDDGVVRLFSRNASVKQDTLDERGNARTPVSIDRFFAFEQRARGLEVNLWKDVEGEYLTHRIGVGLQYHTRTAEEYRDGLQTTLSTGVQTNNLLGEVFPLRDFPISDTTEMAVYIEDTMSFGSWTMIAALRADRFQLEPRQDAMYLEDFPFSEPVSLDESDVSPKLGLIYQATPELDIYLQYSHGFRAPPYSDANIGLEIPLFNVRAVPNPDLKSESSDGFDLGIRWMKPNFNAHLSLFNTQYEDFIETKVRLGADPVTGRILFQSQNLRETEIKGIEAGLNWRFGGPRRAFGLDMSAYYAEGENKENGLALNSVGPPQAVMGISWFSQDERRQLRLKTTLSDGWTERNESGGELFMPPGYGVVDLFFTQQFGKHTTVRAGVHNLGDKSYWHWAEIRGLSPNDPMLPYLARAGRSASLSVSMNW